MSSERVFGIHAVSAALDAGRDCQQLWVLGNRGDKRLAAVLKKAASAGVQVQRVARRELDQLADDHRHQGIVAEFSAATPLAMADSLEELLEDLDGPPFLLVLDGVQDPHNLGACLRTADAAGVQAVIVPKDKAAGVTPTVRKVAAGAAETVPVFQVTNLARTLRDLKERGIWLVGLAGEATQSLYQTDLKGPLAVVMGAEGEGLRRLTRETCDFLAFLPMSGKVESLNVSVATGICLYEAVRQRNS